MLKTYQLLKSVRFKIFGPSVLKYFTAQTQLDIKSNHDYAFGLRKTVKIKDPDLNDCDDGKELSDFAACLDKNLKEELGRRRKDLCYHPFFKVRIDIFLKHARVF